MIHSVCGVDAFKIVAPYTLEVVFNDRTKQTIDFRPVLEGAWYEALQDIALFNAVKIDPEVDTLVWPNGADFDPATLHDWPEYVPGLIDRARQWSKEQVHM